MPYREIDPDELLQLLATEEVVRIAFHSIKGIYVIPLGYVLVSGQLAGLAQRGRKLELAASNPRVGFQVDSSARTGPFEWWSVTGEGDFRVVTEISPVEHVLRAMRPAMERAPAWWQAEQEEQLKQGEIVAWQLQATWMTGRRYAAPQR